MSCRPTSSKRRKQREAAYARSNICFCCEKEISDINEATLEHIFPISLGGTNEKYNLAVAHDICNKKKGNQIWLKASLC